MIYMRLVNYYANKRIIDAQWKELRASCPKGKKVIRHPILKFAQQVCLKCESPKHGADDCQGGSATGSTATEEERATRSSDASRWRLDQWALPLQPRLVRIGHTSGPAAGGNDVWLMGVGLDQKGVKVFFGKVEAEVDTRDQSGALLIVKAPKAGADDVGKEVEVTLGGDPDGSRGLKYKYDE
jgi:hypothetical protein